MPIPSRLIFLFCAFVVFSGNAQDIIQLDSLQLALKNADTDTARYKTLRAISKLYSKSNYPKAMDYAKQAYDFAVSKKLKGQEADAMMEMGTIALYQGDYKNASTQYFNALKYYETAADTVHYISVCNNLGATFDRLKEFDKALTYYFKAQELLNNQPDSEHKKNVSPTLFNNIANIYQTKGDVPSALQYYKKALELALKVPLHQVQGMANNNIGKLYLIDLKKPAEALPYLLKGLEVREQIGNEGETAKSLIILSEYYWQQKNFREALRLSERALAIGKKTVSWDIQMSAYSTLSQAQESLGDPVQALASYKRYASLNDSIQSEAAKSEITKLQLQYDFDKLEKDRQQETEKARFRYVTTIVVLSAFLLLAIAIVIVIRLRSKQNELLRKNLAQDIEIKNKELTTNVMYLIRKNELINSVAERLLKVEDKLLADDQKTIHDIILDLQKEADNDTWREFELRFNQVHIDFYNKLRKLYPDLSPADEKLCALLRLNMSSKEIAAITQQSIKSVEVARARLRKKLNLTNTNSNLVGHLTGI